MVEFMDGFGKFVLVSADVLEKFKVSLFAFGILSQFGSKNVSEGEFSITKNG